ncbi:YggN family protein [uncultured Shewanella sp.]|uniref:YggN family protein n=1 Tax=Shewanella atlantica TaxID=271099 RepID=UPI00260A7915|nr:YggN family protein [uncultured Shewanella sp.]
MRKLATSIGISAALFVGSAVTFVSAHEEHSSNSYQSHNEQCEVALNYDVAVEPQLMTVSDGDSELYRIELDKLYVDGKRVSLDGKQQRLLTQYSQEVARQLPEVITLVHDAVGIASSAASMALTPLLGDAAGAKLDEMMDGFEERVEQVAYQHGDKFYLGSTQSSLEDTFDKEFEKEMEELIRSSVGTMMVNLGSEILSGDGDSFEQKMESFSRKMENVGEEIEVQIEAQAKDLEKRAEKMCDDFQYLIALEQNLRAEVPQLSEYRLIDASAKELLE